MVGTNSNKRKGITKQKVVIGDEDARALVSEIPASETTIKETFEELQGKVFFF